MLDVIWNIYISVKTLNVKDQASYSNITTYLYFFGIRYCLETGADYHKNKIYFFKYLMNNNEPLMENILLLTKLLYLILVFHFQYCIYY